MGRWVFPYVLRYKGAKTVTLDTEKISLRASVEKVKPCLESSTGIYDEFDVPTETPNFYQAP